MAKKIGYFFSLINYIFEISDVKNRVLKGPIIKHSHNINLSHQTKLMVFYIFSTFYFSIFLFIISLQLTLTRLILAQLTLARLTWAITHKRKPSKSKNQKNVHGK